MKFLVDAQLPRRLAHEMRAWGADALHTLDLAAQNRTTDGEITHLAMEQGRVVVTKDSDFVDRLLMKGEPQKLLFIATGNISNDELVRILRGNWAAITSMLAQGSYVELGRTVLTLHF